MIKSLTSIRFEGLFVPIPTKPSSLTYRPVIPSEPLINAVPITSNFLRTLLFETTSINGLFSSYFLLFSILHSASAGILSYPTTYIPVLSIATDWASSSSLLGLEVTLHIKLPSFKLLFSILHSSFPGILSFPTTYIPVLSTATE